MLMLYKLYMYYIIYIYYLIMFIADKKCQKGSDVKKKNASDGHPIPWDFMGPKTYISLYMAMD